MRLLHSKSLNVSEFISSSIPDYVILSHTWGLEEVSFDDICNGTGTQRKGYEKLLGTCAQAALDGYDWVWIDTCCINKNSSAKLEESVNSMYRWYSQSNICYAYLEDVPDERAGWGEEFKSSRWWGRG